MYRVKVTKKELGSIVVDNNAIKKDPNRVHALLKSITSDLTKNHIVCTGVCAGNLLISFSSDSDYTIDIRSSKDGRIITLYHEKVVLTTE